MIYIYLTSGLAVVSSLAFWWRRRNARKRATRCAVQPGNDRRSTDRTRAEERLRVELERYKERFAPPANAKDAVEKDPERAVRAIRAMMKQP